MSTLTPSVSLVPQDVERAGERDGKLYELIDGELNEKSLGFDALFIAGRIISLLNGPAGLSVGRGQRLPGDAGQR